uniref:Uncharacterized protein n=1 Tax=Triticum urartu TaxID=4572 RepID=A0A8R7K4F2_TRIUA
TSSFILTNAIPASFSEDNSKNFFGLPNPVMAYYQSGDKSLICRNHRSFLTFISIKLKLARYANCDFRIGISYLKLNRAFGS